MLLCPVCVPLAVQVFCGRRIKAAYQYRGSAEGESAFVWHRSMNGNDYVKVYEASKSGARCKFHPRCRGTGTPP